MADKFEEARAIAKVIVRHFEGDKLTSYVLPGEGWATISVGVAIPIKQHPKTITQAESDKMYDAAFKRKEAQLRKEIPTTVLDKLTAGQLACVLSFRYNVKDSAWLSANCNTRKNLVDGNFEKFLAMHGLWVSGEAGPLAGLKRRRRVEREIGQGKPLAEIKAANWYQGQY